MTASLFEKIAWVIAGILLIPVVINPVSWPIAITLALAVLATYYVGEYVLDLEKKRREGERGMVSQVRYNRGGER